MSSPMSRVSSLVSRDIASYLTNQQTWSGILTSVKAFGAKGDGVTDDTASFVAAADSGLPIVVPATSAFYLLTSGFNLTNSMIGLGFPKIFIQGDGSEACRLINIIDQTSKSIEIAGLHMDGGYTSGTVDEQSHLVYIKGSTNVSVHHNKIERPYGDCVYIGSGVADVSTYSENINVYRNELLAPRRCDVAVVSAKKVWITENNMTHPNGYVSAIDLEPNNNATDTPLDDITIEGNTCVGTIYFVNYIDPVARSSNRLVIRNNNVVASFLFRVSTSGVGTMDDITIDDNTFTGSGRFISCNGAQITNLKAINNKDYATNNSGWSLTSIIAPIVEDNFISASRSIGITFADCQNVQLKQNTFKDVFSSSGAVSFGGTAAQSGHMVISNTFLNSDYSTQWLGSVFSKCLVDDNFFFFNRRAVDIQASATGSDIRVTSNNRYAGAGTTKVVGSANNTNQNDGYVNSIALTPNFVGQLAVVGSLTYVAKGITAATDWNQVGRYVSVPASATATGSIGDIAADASFLYVCHATNTWKRVAIATW